MAIVTPSASNGVVTRSERATRRNRVLLASVLAVPVVTALASSAMAATVYWDSNGATAGGSATATAAGTWGSSAFWGTDPNGTVATAAWVASNVAIFSAGTNVT